ncbi:tRNA (adenosine(37)-N6)-threonylcarbamoyltransferase complex dimerization subunit type 1 TsaB [Geodermatophilus sp. SYSU D01119]
MLVLALDTATPTLVAGVARRSDDGGVEVLAERAVPSGNRHAELLVPAVREALAEAGVALADVGAVVTGLGPGPFTGLRVGVVTAAALADARGVPAVGVCSLDAVGSGERTVVTDARRKEVYWAAYDAAGARVDGPGVVRPEEFAARRPLVGDPRFAERLGAAVTPAEVTVAGLLRAAAPLLADPSALSSPTQPPLVPLYLRRPDAVPPTSFKPVTTS